MRISRVLLGTVVGSLLLAGCFEYSSTYRETKPYLIHKEKELLEAYYEEYWDSGYDSTLTAIRVTRLLTKKGEATEGFSIIKESTPPFCDVLPALQQEESTGARKSHKAKKDISGMWFKFKGKTLKQSCDTFNGVEEEVTVKEIISDPTQVVPTEVEKRLQVVQATVQMGGNTILSPTKYRELTLVAKECNRAKIELLSLTTNGRLLTVDDYDSTIKLAVGCEALKMQIELNK